MLEAKLTLMEGGPERMLKTQQQMADHLYDIRETIATGRGAWLAIAGIAAVAGSVGALHRFRGRRPGNRSRTANVGSPSAAARRARSRVPTPVRRYSRC